MYPHNFFTNGAPYGVLACCFA